MFVFLAFSMNPIGMCALVANLHRDTKRDHFTATQAIEGLLSPAIPGSSLERGIAISGPLGRNSVEGGALSVPASVLPA